MRLSLSTTALKSRRKRTHGSPLPFGPVPDSNASIAALTTSLHYRAGMSTYHGALRRIAK
jgi:hypothetical protein